MKLSGLFRFAIFLALMGVVTYCKPRQNWLTVKIQAGKIANNIIVRDNTGGVQIFNEGTIQFSKNTFAMTGMLGLSHSTAGGNFTGNVIESASNKAIICDGSPNNTFGGNTISNRTCPGNQATFMSYGSTGTNNVLTNNEIDRGTGGRYYDAVLGASPKASMNYDEAGNLIL